MLLTKQETRKCFFSIRLPLLVRFYLLAYASKRRRGVLGWLASAVLRRVFKFVRSLPLRWNPGVFHYQAADVEKTIRFDPRNTQFHSIYSPKYENGYEPETSLLLDVCLQRCKVFWDVGSNWGHFALYACSHPHFTGSVHAFEPMPDTFRDLQSVISQAGLQAQVECHNFALGDTNGSCAAVLPDGVHSGMAQIDGQGAGVAVQVHAAKGLNLADPDLIKLDVEGFEAAVLRGADEILDRAKPMLILESWLENPTKTIEPLLMLESHGYRLFEPCWLYTSAHGEFHARSAKLHGKSLERLGLSLIPFKASERCLRGEYANLFACHEDNLAELNQSICRNGF